MFMFVSCKYELYIRTYVLEYESTKHLQFMNIHAQMDYIFLFESMKQLQFSYVLCEDDLWACMYVLYFLE